MQRKATKQSRAINAEERRHLNWIKARGICAACGMGGGVIAHHFAGSSAKVCVGLNRVMIGHWAVNGLCQCCDDIVTHGSRKAFREKFGTESSVWLRQAEQYHVDIPLDVIGAIAKWGR
jgi:hypothetical protein